MWFRQYAESLADEVVVAAGETGPTEADRMDGVMDTVVVVAPEAEAEVVTECV